MANSDGSRTGATKKAASSSSSSRDNDRTSGQTEGAPPADGSGTDDAVQTAHEARTTLGDDSGLVEGAVVDARLDNREGANRPRQVAFPAVPQQVDGPDLAHQAEFTRRFLEQQEQERATDLLGQHSPGPHGLSSLEERKGHDRAEESGGESADDGESGSPIVGKPEARGSQRP